MMYWWAVLPFCKGIASATHIDAVNHGQYAALQYLFEALGSFPADIQNETTGCFGLQLGCAALGLPEVFASDNTVTKDSAQS